MKRILFISLLLFSFLVGFSQANVSSTGISFQGIARDNSNNALANQNGLAIVVTIFTGTGTNEKTLLSKTANINSDGLGVFSYTMPISASEFVLLQNNESWIRIASNGIVFVQEQLRTVPYAIQAQNGVPSGAIMAYLGSTAPAGWMLADGGAIPQNDAAYATLKSIYGTNVPDLRGMFLRGAGTNGSNSNHAGPSLKTFQDDALKSHTHKVSMSGTTSTNGSHSHDARRNQGGNSGIASFQDPLSSVATNTDSDNDYKTITKEAGAHLHTLNITGSAGANGSDDTRPINYGVTYIIKI